MPPRSDLPETTEGVGTMKKIFILHGWTYSTDKWQEFAEYMRAANFECVFLNVPGLTEVSDKVWDLDMYVEWLKSKLDAEDKPVIIGHSNGGRIALAFASKYPGKVGRLILVDSAGIHHSDALITLKRTVFKFLAKTGKLVTNSELMRKLLYKLARESDYKNADANMRQTMGNLIKVDLAPILPTINTPTNIIWGRHDKATPLSDGMTMNNLINSSDLTIINEAAHSPHVTHAKRLSEIVISKLNV